MSLKNVLKVKDPKLSRVLIVRNNVTLPCKVQKTTMKTEILPLNVVNDQLVIFLFPVNVFRPKFAAAGLPTKLRNVQLASFFRLYFCCLLDQDLKGQCR